MILYSLSHLSSSLNVTLNHGVASSINFLYLPSFFSRSVFQMKAQLIETLQVVNINRHSVHVVVVIRE